MDQIGKYPLVKNWGWRRRRFFCNLVAGEVKVTKHKKLLNILSPGERFGEMA
jgi:hypothetical protein